MILQTNLALSTALRAAAAGGRVMKCSRRPLVFSTLCAAFCLASLSPAQIPPRSEVQPPTRSAPSASDRSPASTSNGARFINPKQGQIVHPGETIHIDLAVDSGITPVKALAIVSSMGLSNETRERPPYSFTLTVPEDHPRDSSRRLIGFQDLTLFGTVVGRKDYALASTTVDVEEPDLPLSFFAAGNMMSQYDPIPNHLDFDAAGENQEIGIYAKFPNGRELDVTESTYLSLSSENPAVVIATHDGTVTSVGPGQTRIIATYSLGKQQKRFYVSVTVQIPSHTARNPTR